MDVSYVETTEKAPVQAKKETQPEKVARLNRSISEHKPLQIQEATASGRYGGGPDAIERSINAEEAPLIDELISLQRGEDEATPDEITEAIEEARKEVAQVRDRESEAISKSDDQELIKALAAIRTTSGKRVDVELVRTLVSKQEDQAVAKKEAEETFKAANEWHKGIRKGENTIEDERKAKDGSLTHKIKFALSKQHRRIKINEQRKIREAKSDQIFSQKEGELQIATEAEAQTLLEIEQLITGGLSLDEVLSHFSVFKGKTYGSIEDDLTRAATRFQVHEGIADFEKTFLGNISEIRDSKLFEELPEHIRTKIKKITEAIEVSNKAIQGRNLEDTRKEELSKIGSKFREEIGALYDKTTTKDDVFRYKSEELRFVPTTAELRQIQDLAEIGLDISEISKILTRARDRLELASRADDSYITHTTSVNRALAIIQSGEIMSPGKIASLRGGKREHYSNSPQGTEEDESFMTLNNFESVYLDSTRYEKKLPKELRRVEDPHGELGAIFVANFGEIGSQKDWYWQQNSQNKWHGAEEVAIRHDDKPLNIENFYILIAENNPEALALYTKHLLESGKTQEWIDEHLLPIIKKDSTDKKICDEIEKTLKEKGIIGGKKGELFIPSLTGQVRGGVHGDSGIGTFRLNELSGHPEDSPEIKDIIPELPRKSFLEGFRPRSEWYSDYDPNGIHGISHEARVLILSELLSRILIAKGIDIDQEAIRIAASTHDTKRQADGTDRGHGARSSEWVKQEFDNLGFQIDEETTRTVEFINKWHELNDELAPRESQKEIASLMAFKDADGLDRVRIKDLNPKILRYKESIQYLLPIAQSLFERSESLRREGKDPFDAVLEAASSLGLITNN